MRLIALALLLAAFSFTGSAAQAEDPLQLQLVSVEETPGSLTVVVSAFDGEGNPLSELTPANFRASIDETSLAIDSVELEAGERTTTGIVLLVDVSGSMEGEPIEQARAAMQEFILNLNPADEVALLTFSTDVTEVQDFTNDRDLLARAIASLEPGGNTALFDAVVQGTAKAASFPTNRQMVVLLSDGLATVNESNRDISVEAATNSGASIYAIGLGSEVDKAYLTEVTDASGGLLLEADTPAALRQEYVDLAASIRNQYTLRIPVPDSVDRSVQSLLSIRLSVRVDSTTVEALLEPLAGAVPPPFTLTLSGLTAGQEVASVVQVTPQVPSEVTLARVDYFVGDTLIFSIEESPFALPLEVSELLAGTHLLRVEGIDDRGRVGGTQVAFVVPIPPQPSGLSKAAPVIGGGIAAFVVLALIFLLLKRRKPHVEVFVEKRVRPWEAKSEDPPASEGPVAEWPEPIVPKAVAPLREMARLVVMDEAAIRDGNFSAIQEFSISDAPLTLGTASSCDICIEDAAGGIAGEEARLWVQRGRLVYHKLTTLSAMATDGATGGWLFLEDGEELRIGPYRVLFQMQAPDSSIDAIGDGAASAGLSETIAPSTGQDRPEGAGRSELWPDDPSLQPGTR